MIFEDPYGSSNDGGDEKSSNPKMHGNKMEVKLESEGMRNCVC